MKRRWIAAVALLLTAVLLLGAAPAVPRAVPDGGFSDVSDTAWYAGAVGYVTGHGYFFGTGAHTFTPGGTMTRGMVVAVLYRMSGSPDTAFRPVFADMTASRYDAVAAVWAHDCGIAAGVGDGTRFDPDGAVTREALAALLCRYAAWRGACAKPLGNLGAFADWDAVSRWAWDTLAWANGFGIIRGDGYRVNPRGDATRAEVAVMMMQLDAFFARDTDDGAYAALDGSSAHYRYVFANAGTAGGTVALIVPVTGEYVALWGDGNTPLADFTPLFSRSCTAWVESTVSINTKTAIPAAATQLLICRDGALVAIYDIPKAHLPDYGAEQLVFSALSDIHMGTRYGDPKIPQIAFRTALNTVAGLGASLVGICGDITGNGGDTDTLVSEMKQYYNVTANFQGAFPNIPVYTCTGNHDTTSDEKNALLVKDAESGKTLWERYTADSPAYSGDYVRTHDDGRGDFCVDAGDAVFIFLSQQTGDYTGLGYDRLYKEQLTWLGERFAAYRDRTVYLFFHSFFRRTVGDATNGRYFYPLPLYPGFADADALKLLLDAYPNVVYFSGHSHWEFAAQSTRNYRAGTYDNDNANVYLSDGAVYVHVPSVAEPRALVGFENDRLSLHGTSSQGYLVTQYENCKILRGIEFTDTDTRVRSEYYYILLAGDAYVRN